MHQKLQLELSFSEVCWVQLALLMAVQPPIAAMICVPEVKKLSKKIAQAEEAAWGPDWTSIGGDLPVVPNLREPDPDSPRGSIFGAIWPPLPNSPGDWKRNGLPIKRKRPDW